MSISSINAFCRLPLVCLCLCGCNGDRTGELIAQLDDSSIEARRAAARELGRQTGADERVVAALAVAMKDRDAELRRLAIYSLGQIGPPAKSSLPALKTALNDSEAPVRRRAALAIQRIDAADRSFAPTLVAALRAGDGRVYLEIGAAGEKAAWAIPTLISLLNHDSPKVRSLAARTLGRIGPSAMSAKPALQLALRDANAAVQGAASDALNRLESHAAASK